MPSKCRAVVSSLCLLRQVSSTLSRICGNEPRPDVDEAVVCGRNSWHGNCISAMGSAGQRSLREAALKLGLLNAEQFDSWVHPEEMTHPLGGK